MVADVHRTLLYGGIFGYPDDKKSKDGKSFRASRTGSRDLMMLWLRQIEDALRSFPDGVPYRTGRCSG